MFTDGRFDKRRGLPEKYNYISLLRESLTIIMIRGHGRLGVILVVVAIVAVLVMVGIGAAFLMNDHGGSGTAQSSPQNTKTPAGPTITGNNGTGQRSVTNTTIPSKNTTTSMTITKTTITPTKNASSVSNSTTNGTTPVSPPPVGKINVLLSIDYSGSWTATLEGYFVTNGVTSYYDWTYSGTGPQLYPLSEPSDVTNWYIGGGGWKDSSSSATLTISILTADGATLTHNSTTTSAYGASISELINPDAKTAPTLEISQDALWYDYNVLYATQGGFDVMLDNIIGTSGEASTVTDSMNLYDKISVDYDGSSDTNHYAVLAANPVKVVGGSAVFSITYTKAGKYDVYLTPVDANGDIVGPTYDLPVTCLAYDQTVANMTVTATDNHNGTTTINFWFLTWEKSWSEDDAILMPTTITIGNYTVPDMGSPQGYIPTNVGTGYWDYVPGMWGQGEGWFVVPTGDSHTVILWYNGIEMKQMTG